MIVFSTADGRVGEVIKAIRYHNLDVARRILREVGRDQSDAHILDDGGTEPQGLLAVVPEDRLPEEVFSRLFNAKKGILVEVEKIFYSGYGPPSEEDDYMGFATENVAYVLKGCRFAVEIETCPQGARDIHHLEALVMDHQHPLNHQDLGNKLRLGSNWDFEELFRLIARGKYTAQEIDQLIHQGIQ